MISQHAPIGLNSPNQPSLNETQSGVSNRPHAKRRLSARHLKSKLASNAIFLLLQLPVFISLASSIQANSPTLSAKTGDDFHGQISKTNTLRREKDNNILDRHISHFEPLYYDHHEVHRRVKRDLKSSSDQTDGKSSQSHPIAIDFTAHNRIFKLRLRPDVNSVFAKEAVIEDGQGNSLKEHLEDRLYSLSGHLDSEPHDSRVYGSLKKGVFEGKIHANDRDIYYVEKSFRYLDSLRKHNENFKNITKPEDLKFHSLIYSNSDVSHPHVGEQSEHHHLDHLATLGSSCGEQNDQIKSWLKKVSESAVDDPEIDNDKSSDDETSKSQREIFYERMSKLYKYSFDVDRFDLSSPINRDQEGHLGSWQRPDSARTCDNSTTIANQSCHHNLTKENLSRTKRQADIFDFSLQSPMRRISQRPPIGDGPQRQKRACTLYIQTDTYLWNHTRRLHDNDLDTREDIASLVAQHIKAVNHIYENSDFGGIRGLKFIVQRLRINDTSACDSTRRATNPFCQPNIDVSNFLNLNSQFNHNDFCLAYIFTYRDFTGGTLGLAWVASTSGASGGICEKYKPYTENVLGKQVQTKRSLNTGIITFVNYNSRVPPKVSELTLAHEIGHNFGSPHDFPQDCRPGGSQGNFIMYASATSGERPNNHRFSYCSVKNITSVLMAVTSTDNKDNCFEVDNGPFCGNKIVEEGEECDCGYNAQECTEKCCVPREVSLDGDYGGSLSCHRVRGKECSPSEGPCCGDECSFAGRDKMCRMETECSHSQTCDNTQASCPESTPKPNMTECNNGTQVCMSGKCGGSICMKYHMEECFLTAKTGAKPEDMCEVACQQPDQPNTCRRTSEIPEMKHMSGLKLRPGSPCNEFLGYCDVFQRCRSVDAEGPLARLKNTLLNQRNLLSIKQWAITHWWACALFAIGFMMLMYVFIECCAVHTPTSNPNKKPALRFSDTIRHPAHTLRRKRHEHNRRPRGPMPGSSRPNGGSLFPA